MFKPLLSLQLNDLVNQEIRVAVGETLYTGLLLSVLGSYIRISESTDSYERETRSILIPLVEVSFIKAPAN